VHWLRHSLPYIRAHRGKTVVLYAPGEALEPLERRIGLVRDVALLGSLGIRVVMVHGARVQIERRLKKEGLLSSYAQGRRITDQQALECVKEVVGRMRLELEACFAMALANTPAFSTQMQVVSGNWIISKPVGIRDGIDYLYTGEVRRIEAEALRAVLSMESIALISAAGCAPTGEVFNLNTEEVAACCAQSLKADKLLLLTDVLPSADDGSHITHMSPEEGLSYAAAHGDSDPLARHLTIASDVCRAGVNRCHLIPLAHDGAVLEELFTHQGIGTMISRQSYDVLRKAHSADLPGIMALVEPLQQKGILVMRSREQLERMLDDYWVMIHEGIVIACVALHWFATDHCAEIASLAVHEDYKGSRFADTLLAHAEAVVRQRGGRHVFALTTQSSHWFIERGFVRASLADLPMERQYFYDTARSSQVLVKILRRAHDSDPVSQEPSN